MTTIASGGMRIYFINLFFAGVNIIASAFLCSCDKPKLAFVISVLRGFILIIPAAWILSSLFGLTGIWLTVPVTEAIVCLFSFLFLFSRHTHSNRKLKCSQFPSCVDFTGFNGIQNCVYCYYLSFFFQNSFEA